MTPKLSSIAGLLILLSACDSTMPSALVARSAFLPVPPEGSSDLATPGDPVEPPPAEPQDKHYELSARSLIATTFEKHPDIKSSYQRFKVEEARYDFFYVSRDSLTPRMRLENSYDRSGSRGEPTEWSTEHALEVGVEKQFFDTTSIEVATGLSTSIDNGQSGYAPFMSARVRYPLGGSREKLRRASEDIFRQNELDDAQLDYIDKVRSILRRAMEQFYEVLELASRNDAARSWRADLKALEARVTNLPARESDLTRIRAELTQANTEFRNLGGRHEIALVRLKTSTGLPYSCTITLDDELFNPFTGQTHAEILKATQKTDPEIATLRNAAANSRVQLDLALRGNWDIALIFGGEARPGGWGEAENETFWFASAGVEIAKVDSRVTASLTRQAKSSILRFARAIDARIREIHVATLDPMIRIETLSASRTELIANLTLREQDYRNGIDQYTADTLSIDDLLSRRRALFSQVEQIADLTNSIGENTAELFEATGKFFELLDEAAKERK